MSLAPGPRAAEDAAALLFCAVLDEAEEGTSGGAKNPPASVEPQPQHHLQQRKEPKIGDVSCAPSAENRWAGWAASRLPPQSRSLSHCQHLLASQ